ncbi:hypothetical protein COCVIDRAFT_27453 [Bipolaris victoriae FI3]|uniref:Uncharacterized protein n=1 Tax=Bipolaris victoriae (strain FI3) TaxID=930091 RepID=W7EK16_BIPV3|nr:hypothetical protein COCVIDRAFT_27453 [Bipolaris victoriae FI3]
MAANTGFRLGEDQFSEASDSDQSQHSKRSPSPSQANGQVPAQKSKKKKQKDRRKMGALADELVDVLGDAFSAPTAHALTGTDQQTSGDQSIMVDAEPAGKKMNKRTRQNLARMQARKERNSVKMKDVTQDKTLQAEMAAAERRGMSLEEYRKLGSGKGMSKASARRVKKEAMRKQRAAAMVDEMEIG